MRNTVCCLFLLIFSTNAFSVNINLILADSFPDKLSEFEFFVDDSAQEPHEKVVPYELISTLFSDCLLYTSPSPRDRTRSRMPSSA